MQFKYLKAIFMLLNSIVNLVYIDRKYIYMMRTNLVKV